MNRRTFATTALAGVAASGLLPARMAKAATSTLTLQAIWINDPEFNGYFIAIDKGLYAEQGLEIDYIPGGPDVIPQASLLTGKADVALTSPIETAKAIYEKGAPFKVIGAQFQKSPDSVIFMEDSGIKGLKDLEGRTVACPPLNIGPFKILLELNGIDLEKVNFVPYTFDPTPIVLGQVDAVVDFMTAMPFIIEQAAGKPTGHILFSEAKLSYGQNLVCVTEDTLASRRDDLVAFLRASRLGWEEEFKAPGEAAASYLGHWFEGNGYTPELTQYHSKIQVPLIDHPAGVYSMDEDWIANTLKSLQGVGIEATADMFDTSLLAEI